MAATGDAATVYFVPDADWNGATSFTYAAVDDNGSTDASTTATVNVTVNPVNDEPIARDDFFLSPRPVYEDTSLSLPVVELLANDTDRDVNPLTVTGVGTQNTASGTSLNGGTVTLSGGTITYTPSANFFGPDQFFYWISDGQGGTDTNLVFLNVAPVDDAPVAQDDLVSGNEDTPIIIGSVWANDSDVDNLLGPDNIVGFTQGAHGAVSYNGNAFTYTPDLNFNGTDSFVYTLSDVPFYENQVGALTATATVHVTVNPVNDAPVISLTAASLLANGSFERGGSPNVFGWQNPNVGFVSTNYPNHAGRVVASDGGKYLSITAFPDDVVQTVSVTQNQSYILSFDAALAPIGSLSTLNTFDGLWDGTVIATITPTLDASNASQWNHYSYSVLAERPTGTIEFRSVNDPANAGTLNREALVDNVQLSAAQLSIEPARRWRLRAVPRRMGDLSPLQPVGQHWSLDPVARPACPWRRSPHAIRGRHGPLREV